MAIDGSEDSEINITGLEDYQVGESEYEATDDDTDPFGHGHELNTRSYVCIFCMSKLCSL